MNFQYKLGGQVDKPSTLLLLLLLMAPLLNDLEVMLHSPFLQCFEPYHDHLVPHHRGGKTYLKSNAVTGWGVRSSFSGYSGLRSDQNNTKPPYRQKNSRLRIKMSNFMPNQFPTWTPACTCLLEL